MKLTSSESPLQNKRTRRSSAQSSRSLLVRKEVTLQQLALWLPQSAWLLFLVINRALKH